MNESPFTITYHAFSEATIARDAFLATSPKTKVEILRKSSDIDGTCVFELVIYPPEDLTEDIVKARLLDQLFGRAIDN